MREPLPKNYQFKQNSFGHFNKTGYGGQSTSSHSAQSTSSSSESGKKKSGKQAYCMLFNRGEKCKYSNKCRFIERCSMCDQADHHVLICPKLTKKD